MRIAAAMPSPTSMTPAFSPGPTSTPSPVDGRRLRWIRELLYEQCSDHMTEYIDSSRRLGSRPRISTMSPSSESVSPRAMWIGVASASVTQARLPAACRRPEPRSGLGDLDHHRGGLHAGGGHDARLESQLRDRLGGDERHD